MKALLLGDWHFGVKQDDPWIQNIQRDGIRQAIEYSKKNKITRWLQAGDVFDVRKAITHKTMEFTREIMSAINAAGIELDIIVGNHDAHYKDTLTPNACTELLSGYDFITIHDKPGTITVGDVDIDMIPWVCNDNSYEIFNYIKNSVSKYCMGHWELNGFYFYRGMKSHGIEPDFLKNYEQVWSGHFHTISQSNNVVYIGTPWTITAGDANDPRGYWVFDTDSESNIQFIENETMWHRKIFYPECLKESKDLSQFKELSVRVLLNEMNTKFSKFESDLESIAHEVKVVSKIDNEVESTDEEVEVKNILDLMYEYVEAVAKDDTELKSLKSIVKNLYTEVNE